MAFRAGQVANYFLDLARRERTPITPMKLQKLVFIAHGWHLAVLDSPLIDEEVEAWEYGPVIVSLYQEFKRFSKAPIAEKAARLDWTTWHLEEECLPDTPAALPSRRLLDRVWETHREYTATELSKMTHREGTPWAEVSARTGGKLPPRTRIPDALIKAYYKSLSRRKSTEREG